MTDTAAPGLFTPLRIGPYEIANRLLLAPLARARSDENRAPTPIVETYYAQRATAGLLISEATHVSPISVSRPGTSALHTDEQQAAWTRVVSAVHDAGGRLFVQLYHVGRKAHASRLPGGQAPVAPSAVAAAGEIQTESGLQPFSTPRALETDEIPGIVEDFRNAARRALAAGFDGVEIHGANGFLIEQFLRDGSNRRTDAYGGPVENRVRFALAVVDAVVSVFGADRVGIRLSPHFRSDGIADSDPAALYSHLVEQLGTRGLAYLHLIESTDRDTEWGPAGDGPFLADRLRALFKGPLVLAGNYDRDTAEAAVKDGRADAVAFGRLFIANPDLPERFRRNTGLNPPRPETFFTGGSTGYIDYPALAV